MAEQMSKYSALVYPRNRNSGYGKPVVVYASSRQGAIDRAVDIGWSGRPEDARVLITAVEDVAPVVHECRCAPNPPHESGGSE